MTTARTVTGAALVVLGALVGATGMLVTPVHEVELRIDQWFATHRLAGLDAAARVVHTGFGRLMAPILTAVAGLVLVLRRHLDLAVQLVLLIGLGWGVAAFPKLVVERVRPAAGPLVLEPSADSFASGHTAFAVAVAVATVVLLRQRGRRSWPAAVALGGLAALVGILRMYSGVHWLTDVVGGASIATGTVVLLTSPVGALGVVVSRRAPAWSRPFRASGASR